MRDVVSFMRLVFHPEVNTKYDIYTAPSPFREELYQAAANSKVRVGVWTSLPTAPASEPVQRAIRLAREALVKQGFEVVDFELSAKEINEYSEVLTTLIINYVVLPTYREADKNYEKVLPHYKALKMMLQWGPVFRWVVKLFIKISGSKRVVDQINPIRPCSQNYLHLMMYKQTLLVKAMKAKWEELGI